MHCTYGLVRVRPVTRIVDGTVYYKVTTTSLHQDFITPQTASTCLTSRSPEGFLREGTLLLIFQNVICTSKFERKNRGFSRGIVCRAGAEICRHLPQSFIPYFFMCLSHVPEWEFADYMLVSPKDMHIDVAMMWALSESQCHGEIRSLCAVCTTQRPICLVVSFEANLLKWDVTCLPTRNQSDMHDMI